MKTMKPPIKVATRFECQKMSPECPYYGEGAIVNGMPMCTHCYIDMGLYGVFYLVCGDRRAQAAALYQAGRGDD